jgi:hypothetical protein
MQSHIEIVISNVGIGPYGLNNLFFTDRLSASLNEEEKKVKPLVGERDSLAICQKQSIPWV